MNQPVLVIMAAGMGSRYGGLKQIAPIDNEGNKILDFSVYDAIRAGFKKVVFIIKKEIEQAFKESIGDNLEKHIEVNYIFQELNKLPVGYKVPEGRVKPWGTAHAILCCKDIIDGPFAVINADDYYGPDAFKKLYDYLLNMKDTCPQDYAMVGYILSNTLSENGHVARGVCIVDKDGYLKDIKEITKIMPMDGVIKFSMDDGQTWQEIDGNTIVSMNMWGYGKSFIGYIEERFCDFLDKGLAENPLKCEFYLPILTGELVQENKVTVKVLSSTDKWYGVTYKQDHEDVVKAIQGFKDAGIYPHKLW